MALWHPQKTKDCRRRSGTPTGVGRISRGLVATHGEKLPETLMEKGHGVVFIVASRSLRHLPNNGFFPHQNEVPKKRLLYSPETAATTKTSPSAGGSGATSTSRMGVPPT